MSFKSIMTMNNIPKKAMRRPFIVCLMAGLTLFLYACATWVKPPGINEAPMHERAQTKVKNGIRVSAALVSDEEARQIFGIDLAAKKIQAVWLEIENNSAQQFILLPTAIDPDYFAPLEVAFFFHKSFANDYNMALDQHMLEMNFPTRSHIKPMSRVSGYIFTNPSKGAKLLDIDIYGDHFSQNFTLIVPEPGLEQPEITLKRLHSIYSDSEQVHIEKEAQLRDELERLPCCARIGDGGRLAEPLNIVIIGEYIDWATAFTRRGYQYQKLRPRYVFGRVQDLEGEKLSQGYETAQDQTLRIWKTPIRYHGKPVWIGQTSTRLGGRFADKAAPDITLPLDPKVDESRDDLTQDLAYSQGLLKIGYVKGAGYRQHGMMGTPSPDIQYQTDGLRAVWVFDDRPVSLSSIEFFDWERLFDYR